SSSSLSLKSYVIFTSTSRFWTQNHNQVHEYQLAGVDRGIAVDFLQKNYGWSKEQAERVYDVRQGHPHAMHIASGEIKKSMDLGFSFEQAFTRLGSEVFELTYGSLFSKLVGA